MQLRERERDFSLCTEMESSTRYIVNKEKQGTEQYIQNKFWYRCLLNTVQEGVNRYLCLFTFA